MISSVLNYDIKKEEEIMVLCFYKQLQDRMNLLQNKQKQQGFQHTGVLASNKLRLAFCVAALMFLTSCAYSPPSKDKVVAYVEEELGKTPEIISVKKKKSKKKHEKTVIYEMRLEGDDFIFTVDSVVFQGGAGPQTAIWDHYNQAVIDSKMPEAEILAEEYGLSIIKITGVFDHRLEIVLHDEDQAADAVNLYLDLFQLFPFKQNGQAYCHFYMLQDGKEIYLRRLSFSSAREFFEDIESEFSQEYFEQPYPDIIKQALYEEWKAIPERHHDKSAFE